MVTWSGAVVPLDRQNDRCEDMRITAFEKFISFDIVHQGRLVANDGMITSQQSQIVRLFDSVTPDRPLTVSNFLSIYK